MIARWSVCFWLVGCFDCWRDFVLVQDCFVVSYDCCVVFMFGVVVNLACTPVGWWLFVFLD